MYSMNLSEPVVRPDDKSKGTSARQLLGVGALTVLGMFMFACSPDGQDHPILIISILAFLLVQIFLPACRFRLDHPICPANIAQGFYCIQLVVITLSIGYFGMSQGTLPYMPAMDAIDTAIVVHVVGYLSFCMAYQYFQGRSVSAPANKPGQSVGDIGNAAFLIIPFALIGLLGLFLTYGSLSGFVEYATTPRQHRLKMEEPAAADTAAASFLRHFLGFAIVLAWSWWLGRSTNAKHKVMATAGSLVVVGLLLIANFSYNRGTMLGPILAFAAAFSVHVWRLPFKGVVLGGGLILTVAMAFGGYRSSDAELGDGVTTQISNEFEPESLVEFVQIYGSAPQLGAYIIEFVEHEPTFYRGATLVPSMIYPVPILGKPYRTQSGVHIFNELIYGEPDVLDQVLPLDAELYINFHIPGVILGNLILGWVLCFMQRKFLQAANPAETYAWALFSLWIVFPGSLPVISQLFVYSFWPIYTYFLVQFLSNRRVDFAPVRPQVQEPVTDVVFAQAVA